MYCDFWLYVQTLALHLMSAQVNSFIKICLYGMSPSIKLEACSVSINGNPDHLEYSEDVCICGFVMPLPLIHIQV